MKYSEAAVLAAVALHSESTGVTSFTVGDKVVVCGEPGETPSYGESGVVTEVDLDLPSFDGERWVRVVSDSGADLGEFDEYELLPVSAFK